MARRNNKGRTSSPTPFVNEPPQQEEAHLGFTKPTEFVELPSKGRLYPPGHPFHMQEEVEIRFMTAKDEDILSSKVLLSKGLALDRLLQGLLVEKVDTKTLLAGDRNALFIAARITAYGADYAVRVTCPACRAEADYEFDLASLPPKEAPEDIGTTENGTFIVNLPKTGVEVEVRHLNIKEQEYLVKNAESRVKNNLPETSTTDFLKMVLVSVDSETNKTKINSLINNLPAMDSLEIRKAFNRMTPDIDLKQDYQCSSCGTTTALEVPLGGNFFWPR